MLQLFFFYFTFAPAKEPKDLNLIIDIGNTKAKIAFFDGGEIVDIVAESNQSLGCLKAFCSKYPVEQGIVATVIDLSEKVLADFLCSGSIIRLRFRLSTCTKLPKHWDMIVWLP